MRHINKLCTIKHTQMDKIEKLVFLEITNKQFTKFATPDFYETYNLLNDDEQTEFSKISNEIHSIWNRMNTPEILNANKKHNSIHEFLSENEVSPIIVKVINDFDLDLKTEISEQTKKSIINLFGEDYFNDNFGN